MERKAREAAEAAEAAKSDLLTIVGRELRAPMQAVVAMGELLLDSELDAAQRRNTERLGQSAGRLLSSLTEVVDFARLSPAKPRSRSSVWLYDLVLMDTVLPDYDGLKVAKQIRSMHASSSEVSIVGIAARGGKKDDLAYVLAGINARVAQPIQGRALHAALVPFLAAKDELRRSPKQAACQTLSISTPASRIR